MSIRPKMTELRRQLIGGTLPDERPRLSAAISCGLNFLFGLVMGLAVILGSSGPFGIAAVSQAGAGLGGLCCALGASAGYVLSFGLDRGVKYIAAVTLVYTAAYVLQETRLVKRTFFMPLLAACFTLLAGSLGAVEALRSGPVLFPIMTETILAGGASVFFSEALSGRERTTESADLRHGISLVILCACLLIALSRVEIAGVVSLGRLCALLAVMTSAYRGGALSGSAAGAALGMAMDVALGRSPFFSASYAFMGLIGGMFSRRSRLSFVICCVLTNAAAAAWTWRSGAQLEAMYETFAASVIFMLLPPSLLGYLGAFLRPAQLTSGESGLRRYTAARLARMSDAFQDLHDTVDRAFANERCDEDISKVFDCASESVCARCKQKSECWNRDYMDTLSVFNDLTPVINSRGLISENDLPERFRQKCPSTAALVSAVNTELRARVYRQRFRSRLTENRSAAYSQYADLSEVLREVADELRSAYGPDVLAQRRLLRYLSGLGIEADASVFRDRSGRLHIILESERLHILRESGEWLTELSGVVGVRLCAPPRDNPGEGRLTLLEAEPLSASVGIASMKKKGETISGDRGTYFKTDSGVLCVILSDGMGSGSEAAGLSVDAVRILERFLRSGVDPAAAMRMLNSMMLLKNGEEWGFATVDLMCIDLFSGETGFYKYGAAPSYVRSGKTVRRVRCESLAAGLTAGRDSGPDIVRMRLRPGAVAIIASDGVAAGGSDAWLRTILASTDGADTRALARETIQAAAQQYGCSDDMTVLTVRLDSRE